VSHRQANNRYFVSHRQANIKHIVSHRQANNKHIVSKHQANIKHIVSHRQANNRYFVSHRQPNAHTFTVVSVAPSGLVFALGGNPVESVAGLAKRHAKNSFDFLFFSIIRRFFDPLFSDVLLSLCADN